MIILWHTQKLPERGQIAIFNHRTTETFSFLKVHPEIVPAERLPIDTVNPKIDQNFGMAALRWGSIILRKYRKTGTTISQILQFLSPR